MHPIFLPPSIFDTVPYSYYIVVNSVYFLKALPLKWYKLMAGSILASEWSCKRMTLTEPILLHQVQHRTSICKITIRVCFAQHSQLVTYISRVPFSEHLSEFDWVSEATVLRQYGSITVHCCNGITLKHYSHHIIYLS